MDDRQVRAMSERLDEIERDNRERLQELLAEIQRRDRWLISSIWNFIGSLNYLIVFAGIWLTIERTNSAFVDSLAIIALGIVAFFVLAYWTERLEKEDNVKIQRGSILSSWLWDKH